MNKYKVTVTRKSVEQLTVDIPAESFGHADAIVKEWLFNPMPEDKVFYDACFEDLKETDDVITAIELL